ncbi:hypothetical protein DACRYDRAFT_108012 [Dacryopinax primogenitus]|uniref:Peptidase A1 domain-containing protein n=1 Tax=Dacryopinax primogenitus (strain DJM 731) TaxID=1858805 RepID=M5G6L3_DACPD|nr:uncharacterized protein DACRYDRAFT_108012 [Dacryopinax primogenitus]EJU01462.1 hypothetical protein DACRYDRAFT_108012 [Dacryopinax primogenitus]
MTRLSVVSLAFLSLPLAWAWTFTPSSSPTECSLFSISFEGGEAPFQFTFLRPASLDPSLPVDQWGPGWALVFNATSSPAEWILPWHVGDPILIVGSDATGFGTGGTSSLLTVSANSSSSMTSCLTNSANSSYAQHVTQWNGQVSECGLMSTVLTDVQDPINLAIVIAGGYSFIYNNETVLGPSDASTNANGEDVELLWYMSALAGENVTFFGKDADGPLFVSPLMTIQPGNSDCLNTGSAIPNVDGPGPLVTGTAGWSAEPVATSVQGVSDSSTFGLTPATRVGAIIGGVVGGILVTIGIMALVMYVMRRYNRQRRLLRLKSSAIVAYAPRNLESIGIDGPVDLTELRGEKLGANHLPLP